MLCRRRPVQMIPWQKYAAWKSQNEWTAFTCKKTADLLRITKRLFSREIKFLPILWDEFQEVSVRSFREACCTVPILRFTGKTPSFIALYVRWNIHLQFGKSCNSSYGTWKVHIRQLNAFKAICYFHWIYKQDFTTTESELWKRFGNLRLNPFFTE